MKTVSLSFMKKVFIVSSILLFVVLIFLGIYNLAFKKNSPPEAEPVSNNQKEKVLNDLFSDSKKQDSRQEEKIYPVAGEPVIYPTLDKDLKNILYYSKNNGSVYKISPDGAKQETVAENNLEGLVNVLWSPDKNKVITKFQKDGRNEFYFYSYETKSGTRLPDGMDAVSWTNLGDKIIYKQFNFVTKKRTLNISDPDGSNSKKLADLSYRDIGISQIPQSSLVSFWNAPDSFEKTSLNTVGIAGGKIQTLFSEKYGADYLWSPNGNKVLISSADSKGGSKMALGIANGNGGEYQNLDIPTLVSKTVWSKNNKIIYYALPSLSFESITMPNDYNEGKITSRDSFWKMDITTGKKERLIELNDIKNELDAANLFLSAEEDILFFVNKIDGKLYGIDIK